MRRVETLIKSVVIVLMVLALGIGAVAFLSSRKPVDVWDASQNHPVLENKKVLVLHSYHAEYAWSAGVMEGIRSVLDVRTGAQLKICWMDTHRNSSEDFKLKAAQKALALIHEWNPDLVVVSDDDAVKYVVEPYLNRTALPVVFCGVNWSLDRYRLATNSNVTGIIETALYPQLIDTLMSYAKGPRIGFIAGDNVNSTVEAAAVKQAFPQFPVHVYATHTFANWKASVKRACEEVDLLLIDNNAGVDGWDPEEAKRWIYEEVSIPTGSPNGWMSEYCLVTFAKNAREQGCWAAHAACRILTGTPPSAIPVARSQKASIFLNMNLAKKLGVRFPMELIDNAHLIDAD